MPQDIQSLRKAYPKLHRRFQGLIEAGLISRALGSSKPESAIPRLRALLLRHVRLSEGKSSAARW